MQHGHEKLITDRKCKTNKHPTEFGTFHTLPEELQDSVVAYCKKSSAVACKKYTCRKLSAHVSSKEKQNYCRKKLQNAEESYILASCYFQKYHSHESWKTAAQALDEFEKLKTKKDRFNHVKEQIQICYLGLGWEEAHH